MARSSKVWPKWDIQKDNLPFMCPYITRKRYEEIGKHFTTRQFRMVEKALGAPDGYDLLDKMRHAAYYYIDWNSSLNEMLDEKGLGEVGNIRRLPKQKRRKIFKALIKGSEDYLNFLERYHYEFVELFMMDRRFLGQEQRDHILREVIPFAEMRGYVEALIASVKRNYERLENEIRPGRKNAEWDVFFWSIAVIYETVFGKRPTIPRRDDMPYGQFLEFARESLRLIGRYVSDEGIWSALRRYNATARERIMNDNLNEFAYFRSGSIVFRTQSFSGQKRL